MVDQGEVEAGDLVVMDGAETEAMEVDMEVDMGEGAAPLLEAQGVVQLLEDVEVAHLVTHNLIRGQPQEVKVQARAAVVAGVPLMERGLAVHLERRILPNTNLTHVLHPGHNQQAARVQHLHLQKGTSASKGVLRGSFLQKMASIQMMKQMRVLRLTERNQEMKGPRVQPIMMVTSSIQILENIKTMRTAPLLVLVMMMKGFHLDGQNVHLIL